MPKYRKPLPAELPEPEIIDLEALAADLRSGAVDLVCVLGPTASGKTKYAVRLARELAGKGLEAEIISADSRQVYRGMDIGTGKDLAEYEEIPYHLIDIREAGTQYNVYDFVQDFRVAYADIRARGKVAILCGGTGLYINAVTAGYDFRSSKPLSQPADSGRLSVAGSGGGHSATATHGPAQKTSVNGTAVTETDRWIISLKNSLIRDVRAAYEDYDITLAGRLIQTFVCDHLSNWYVRLNRKRFWGGGLTPDKQAAYQTLYDVLKTVTLLAAPIAPFYTDELWLDLVPGAECVHFEKMPEADESLIDRDLEERMELAQKATSLVLALRRKVNIKVRQPLAKMLIPVISDKVREQLEGVKNLILTEVNVKEAEFLADTTGIITKKIKPNFRVLGKKYGAQMKEIAAAFGSLDQATISAIQASAEYTLALPSGPVVLMPEDYEITSEDMPGWLVASEGQLTIALDIQLSDALVREGTARELINRIQNLRKDSGFEVTDKIDVEIGAEGEAAAEIEASLTDYKDYIASQTLALSVALVPGCDGAEVEWNDSTIKIKVIRK